jgi:hypothetical protein
MWLVDGVRRPFVWVHPRPLQTMCCRVALACAAIFASCLSAFAACSQYEQHFLVGAHVVLDRGTPPADQERPLVVCNLVPDQNVRLTFLMRDESGAYFASAAEFYVIDDELNTAKLAPTNGSYSGIRPDGWLWSMRQVPYPPAELARLIGNGDAIAVGVEADKGQRLDAVIARNFGLRQMRKREVRADGLVGELFVPDRESPEGAAIIVLSGADAPGSLVRMSSLLASRGHVVLSLAYSGLEGPLARLRSIPIEYFSRAVDVLRRDHAGERGKIVVLAFGRATEAAAMLALQRNDIERIVLVSPSSVLNAGGEGANGGDSAAWTLNGAALPFMRGAEGEDDMIASQRPPYRTRPRYELRLAALADDDRARIPFDRIKSEVVLIACDGDDVWPSDRMANDILDLARRRGRNNVTAHILPGCGHDLAAPIAPTARREYVTRDGVRYSLGGTPEAAWYGQRAAWSVILRAIGAVDEP